MHASPDLEGPSLPGNPLPENQDPAELPSEPLTIPQALGNLTHADLGLRYYASWWLGRFLPEAKDCTPEQRSQAVSTLILALQDQDDRTELGGYPLRRNAARALGKLGDRQAVPGLIACLSCEDFYVREAAAQSLGMLGDTQCVPMLMQLLDGGVAAAQMVPDRPHLTQPYEAILEALGVLNATEAVGLIQPFLGHAAMVVKYAAARSLYQLTGEPQYGEQLVTALQGSDLQLRRAALSDLGAIGYLPAADAIATAVAENSFKLFSLKGLLEHEVTGSLRGQGEEVLTPPSATALHLMQLMDSLL